MFTCWISCASLFSLFTVEPLSALYLLLTLKDFKNAKNENYYFLHPEHFLPSLTDKNG